jgi:hypothetical protein
MNKFKLILKVCITAMLALIILFVPMLLMILWARYILGLTQMNDTSFLMAMLLMSGISFAFFWWFDKKVKISKAVSNVIDKVIKDKP